MPEKKNDDKITTANVKIPKKSTSAASAQKKTQKGTVHNNSDGNGSRTRQYSDGSDKAGKGSDRKGSKENTKERDAGELTEAQLRRHQFVPLFLILGAILVVLSYLTTINESGIFGTVVRTAFYGVFGIGSFAIPVLLVVAALNWQKYVKSQTILLNTILFCLTMLLASSFVEMVVLAIDAVPSGDWSVSIKDLFIDGTELHNGGVLGGLVGILCWNIFGSVGSFFVVITIILVLVFSLFGATPVTVVTYIRYKFKVSAEKRRERALIESQNKTEEDGAAHSKRKKSTREELHRDAAEERDASNDDSDEYVRFVAPPEKVVAEHEKDIPDKASDATLSEDKADKADSPAPRRPNVTIIRSDTESNDTANETVDEVPSDSNGNLSSIGCNQAFKRRVIVHNSDVSNENGDMNDELQNTLDVGSRANAREQFYENAQIGMTDIPDEPSLNSDDVSTVQSRGKTAKKLDDVQDLDDIIEGVSVEDKGPAEAMSHGKVKSATVGVHLEDKNALKVERDAISDLDEEVLKPDPYANYVFPPTSLLSAPTPNQGITDEEINKNIDKLMDTLTSFKIRVSDISCSCGPTITRFEVKPEAGVRVRSIAGLVDDIALGLAKTGVRIEAPIPGKSAVGIEVPNDRAQTVHLRSLIENKVFTDMKSKISACLGADVSGKPIAFDIHKMPHLLIAGATGMGKSVCINSIIVSLLYKSKPDEVKLILIDPKKVEFGIYKDIPHLYVPIVSNPKKAAGALATAVAEMERRFAIMEEVGVRDIAKYNEITKDDPDMEFMPQIVIIIDELADLMMTAPDEVETSICRITQKARAAGIHLIIGTQRPSVDVITGLIKANIPSRIAFTVASQVDSRTIIDIAGAEKLIGRGDMLYAPVGAAKPLRVQGSYVSESEVESVCEFIKKHNGKAIYNEQFTKQIDQEAEKCGMSKKGSGGTSVGVSSDDGDFSGDGEDPKLREAIEIAVTDQKISTSLLQRKLSIGYGRAAKIIDRMQELNIVSPPDGNKPRRILITKEQFMEMYLNDDI